MDLDQLERVRPFVGVASIHTLRCPIKACRRIATTVKSKPGYDWARTLHCNICNTEWDVCIRCQSARKVFTQTAELRRHEQKTHRKRKLEPQESTTVSANPPQKATSKKEVLGEDVIEHASDASRRYFMDEIKGHGLKNLITKSQFKMENVQDEVYVDDVRMHLNMCRFAIELSRRQRENLAELLNLVVAHERKTTIRALPNDGVLQLQVPRTDNELREMFVKGQYAMIPNLPRPSVVDVGDHVYVSPLECIQDALAHGIELQTISNWRKSSGVVHLGQSEAAREILDKSRNVYGDDACLTLYLVEWSDDFDPNGLNKSGRGGIWLKTMTILPPFAGRQCSKNTYPIAAGPKGSDHEPVERMFFKDLQKIRRKNGFKCYSRSLGRMIPVYADVIVTLGDQPERRQCHWIMAGNGTFTARWRYSCNLKKNLTRFLRAMIVSQNSFKTCPLQDV